MELGSIPTPATRMQRGTTCTFAAGQAPRCSDGRLIATTRSTPVPCEQQQGVWTDVGVNQACVTWDGKLQAHSPNTTMVANGDKLDLSPWGNAGGPGYVAALTKNADGSWRITQSGTATGGREITGITNPVVDEVRTSACIAKRASGSQLSLWVIGSGQLPNDFTLTDDWATYSTTRTVPAGSTSVLAVYVTNPFAGSIDINGCWHVKADMPGRACFGTSASGTTCGADTHAISTEGWPTAKGRIRLVVDFAECRSNNCVALDTRSGTSDGIGVYRGQSRGSRALIRSGGAVYSISGPAMSHGRHVMELVWDGTTARLFVDGVQSGPTINAPAPTGHGAEATLGANLSRGEWWDGSISRLSWSAR